MNENKIIKKLEAFNFFRIEVIADFEYEGKIYKNYKQYNNDSILNSNNWELYKETFFNQRMNFYKESYTLSEKIKLEIEALENLTTNETDYKILKDRYNSFLSNKQNPPQQVENVKPDEVKKELYNHIFKDNAFEVFEKYHTTKNLAENCKTDLNLLFQLFKKDNLFLETVELKHYIKWLNSTYNYSLTELKKVNIKTRPNIQRTNDYKEYKNSTLNKP